MSAERISSSEFAGSVQIPVPPDFHFWRTVYSHGWCDLAPFGFDGSTQTMTRVLRLDDATIVRSAATARHNGVSVRIASDAPITRAMRSRVSRQLRSCLRLDEDFTTFHSVARRHPEFRWIAAARTGRLLRAPTVFEDVVKMICTTNCSWSLTRIMVGNLVALAGDPAPGGDRAFPTPAATAALTERTMRKRVKAGYRSPYLLELARRVADGELDIESWRTSRLSSEDLLKQISSVKGIGPYAAQNILRLLGRYDWLGLDSWVRGQFSRLHARGQKVKDSTIERHYRDYGAWRGLFFWLDMTRHWHEDKFTF